MKISRLKKLSLGQKVSLVLLLLLLIGLPLVFLASLTSVKFFKHAATEDVYCQVGLKSFSVDTSCGTDSYRFMNYVCYDVTYSGRLGSSTSCKTTQTWKTYAQDMCAGRSSCTNHVKNLTPTPVKSCPNSCELPSMCQTRVDGSCPSGLVCCGPRLITPTLSPPRPTPTINITRYPTPTPNSNYIKTNVSCVGPDTSNPSSHVDVTVNTMVNSPTTNGFWMIVTDQKTNNSAIVEYGYRSLISSETWHGFIRSVISQGNILQQIPIVGDNREYLIKVYDAPYTNGIPTLTKLIIQTGFRPFCNFLLTPTPHP